MTNRRILLGLAVGACCVACESSSDSADDMGGFESAGGLPKVQGYRAIWSFGPSDVWVTAEMGRVLHFDGAGWTETQLETNSMMLDIWAFGPDDMWMVGGNHLAHYDGAQWTLRDLSEEHAGLQGLAGLWGTGPEDMWVVGTQSTAAHWDGTTWTRHIAAGPENHAVWGSGSDDVYVTGQMGLAHWDGSAWEEIEIDEMGAHAESVWGFGSDDVWIAGDGEVAHFDGTSWSWERLDFTAEGDVVWGRGPKDLWAVGTPGGILHYDGAWHEVAHQKIGSPYLRKFHGVHGSSQGDVWVIGTELGESGAKPLLWTRR